MYKEYTVISLLSLVATTALSAQNNEQKNVLFIAVDDMKPLLGCFGDNIAITPNINMLANDGLIFKQAYCQQAVSGPSRASLLTGLRPNQTGVTELNTSMRKKLPDVITLPQAFKMNGYETRGIGKIFHGPKNSADSRSWSQAPKRFAYTKADEYHLTENQTGKKAKALEVTDLPDEEYLDGRTAHEALLQMDELSRSRTPFFLAVGFLKPHLPFCMPQKYWDMYSGMSMGLNNKDRARPIDVPEIAYHNSDELRGYSDIPDVGALTKEQEVLLRRGYYACISFVDAQIGLLINKLKALGVYENTIIVLWGDHGYHLGEQELWCKSTNYEAACNAPLIIHAPQKAKSVNNTSAIVELVDIYPTLVDLCELKVETKLAGKSLRPLLEGKKWDKKYAVSQYQRPYRSLFDASKREYMGYVIRSKEWRYCLWYDLKGNVVSKELYNMTQNRYEKINVAGKPKYAKTEKTLAAKLQEIITQ